MLLFPTLLYGSKSLAYVTRVPNVALHNRRDKKLTVTLVIVTIVSLIAWIPFQVFSISWHYSNSGELELLHFLKVLHYGNSLANPIIYALRMPEFKTAILRTIWCCRNQKVQVNVRVHNPPSVFYQETKL